ncbi:hypothetical protein M670_03704 [Schinkia azotoformans MEV2011]|uniref:Uncharacterized protein n=1 Tax=Schinkia azotoformans MEV2011 TaxID=1348973 RepID=A0A072NI14_SCHAZ|nr:hypothetical protein [Schinkia azotoformans]KEF37111.1 hypothetical protein M670_03704 [Schinkia azotoformans MEV2011]MEC1694332.1 hypothetical protein [Schinkia azotoformans]MEC1717977.1 hypothetical protein [Schinkia azotoformans]MEC1723385.1 hypothetical protein [Schinkia azotoformans]MEC1743296.1 hypothetical protein [Schinkia azotoformans]
MGEVDTAFTIYIVIMLVGFFISYKYSSYMIRKTGLFFPQAFIAGTMIIAIDVIAIVGWSYYSWGTNEFTFIVGILFGFGLLVVSEAVLIAILFIRRKHMMRTYNDDLNQKS